MKKKILITYASYGNGHKAAAIYIYDYFQKNSFNYDLKLIDVMEYGNLLAKIDNKNFYLNYKYKPNHLIFTMSYILSDNKFITSPYKEVVKLLLKRKLKKDILEYKPDIVISTHFFGSILMGIIKKKYHLKTKIITIVTDYKAHYFWIKNHKNEDAIIVSNNIVKNNLIKLGVPKEKIYPFGIPLSSKFKNTEKKDIIKKRYQITNHNLTVLFLGGGSYGSNFSYNYLKALVKEKLNINLIFVAGTNQKLVEKSRRLVEEEQSQNTTILGYTNDIFNLLNIADLVITKPGGLSITEAMEMNTPMLLIPGNGGPEVYNAKFIVKNNFGLKTRSPKILLKKLKFLLEKKELITEMTANLKNIEENKSLEKLFNLVKEMDVNK